MENLYTSDPTLHVAPAYYSDGVPVFTPTMDEFRDFYKYNKAINKYGMQSGIAKIIPPTEWTRLLQGTYTEENLRRIRIRNPIIQNMNVTAGHQGVYSLQNVERQRSYDIYQWKSLSQRANYVPPTHKKTRRGLPPAELQKADAPPPKRTVALTTHEVAAKLLSGDFNIDISEFSAERCEELEQLYWKSLSYAEPMYGADVLGSIFKESTTAWNVAHLPNVLDLMEEKIPGVNEAYLYAGLWKASFSWHLEDQDLYSINYLHFGAPKQWYSIPQKQHQQFYALMKDIFSEDYKQCHEFLRHKTFLASPQFLAKHGIICNKIVHNQGEFMITYPYGYHAGFNYGYNLAESVNFALDDWFPFAEKTHKCECISDAVAINFRMIYCKFKGIPYQPTSTGLVTSPIQDKHPAPKPSTTYDVAAPQKKKPGRKRRRIEPPWYECILCPNNLAPTLTRLRPFELLSTDALDHKSKKIFQAHRVCASMFPDQLVVESSFSGDPREDMVKGTDLLTRAQRNLVCSVCRTRNRILVSTTSPSHGGCFQCSAPKCTRSFHGTCALAGGFLFDKNLCKQHRKMPHFDGADSQNRAGLSINQGNIIQFSISATGSKRHTGTVFCGLVIRNNHTESTVEVLIYPHLTESMEVLYENVFLSDSGELYNGEFSTLGVSNESLFQPIRLKSVPDIGSHLPMPFHLHHPNYTTERGPAAFSPESMNRIVFINEFSDGGMSMDGRTPIQFVSESFHDI